MSNVYNPQEVADRIRGVAKLRGVSVNSVLEDCGLNYNTLTNMRNSMPSARNLGKLADRLECSVDYLLGRTKEMLTAGTPQALPSLSGDATEMLSLYVQLPEREQHILLGTLRQMVNPLQGPAGKKAAEASREAG